MNVMQKGRLIEENKNKIIEQYEFGMNVPHIAKEYGLSKTALYKNFKKWGIKLSFKKYENIGDEISPEVRAKMKENSRINRLYIKNYNIIK